jgi:hypothetical protein
MLRRGVFWLLQFGTSFAYKNKRKEPTGGNEMYHSIEFRLKGLADLEMPGRVQVARVLIKPGTRIKAEITPYVAETPWGPVEMADLHLEDGGIARGVRYATFNFLDDLKQRSE